MNKILVTVVLGVAASAAAQNAGQTAQPPQGQAPQGQPAAAAPAAASQAPVIKDPAEYNAYVAAINQKDAAQISGLEAFLTQYPNSIMKVSALQVLMQDYQQANNQQKAVDTATKLVAADACNERSIFLLSYIDRLKAQGGDPNATQDLADAKKYAQMGLDCMPKFTKPDGTSDGDYQKMKDQMNGTFYAALGLAALTDKDYENARKNLRAAVDSSPDFQKDFSVVYPLALAYAGPKPPDPKLTPEPINAIWFTARASVIAPTPQYQQQFEKYAKSLYVKYHGGEDGWDAILAAAKAGAGPVPEMKPAPSPDEQAHNMVVATPPDKMDFATWEFVLSNGKKDDQDAVWNAIKGKPVFMNGKVIKATATEFDIAASEDDIEANRADVILTFEEKVPLRLIPKEGASLDFQGEPASYTPNPFVMNMEKGLLPKPKTAPKTPVHHKAATQ